MAIAHSTLTAQGHISVPPQFAGSSASALARSSSATMSASTSWFAGSAVTRRRMCTDRAYDESR